MIPVKGHKYLLEAMAILRRRQVECELVLAGDGPLRKRLEKTAQALGVADIARFVGRLSHEGLLSLYRKGEVGLVVLPSVDLGDGEHEGIPISLVEAMAHGVPVVSTETGGIPELLADGCGLLVPGGESTALADAVARGITDDGLRRDLTAKGHQRAVEEYAVEKVVDELERRIETAQACVD
jgi:glycosyltransferase involved in cell wall biosynthesis